MSTPAEALASIREKAWTEIELHISGETVLVPIRRLSPRMFFDIYGAVFAALPDADANGKGKSKKKVRLLSEEAAAEGKAITADDPSLFVANIEAAERTVMFGCVKEIGSHDQLFEDPIELSIFSIEELTAAAEKILQFSGVSKEAGDTVRGFRAKS